jgi:phytoene synthase
MTPTALADAYRHCERIATSHYENFTVGSWLLPRRQRRHLAALYAFARTADDLADEGDAPRAERLAALDAYESALERCFAGFADDPVFVALGHSVRECELPIEPFRRLLQAFRADVRWRGFETVDELLAYCACSANPVGHLVLYLFGHRDAERQALADRICTGLQLANLWQDLGRDVARGRLYLPRAVLREAGCDPEAVVRGEDGPALRQVLRAEVARARTLLTDGLGLADRVGRRLGREVRLFAGGGLAILDEIDACDYAVLAHRPTVGAARKARLVLGAMLPATVSPATSMPVAPGGEAASLREAYAYCREVTRRSSSNFSYAFHLLPAERRDALYALYAFCRFVDEIADDGGERNPAGLLATWRDELDRVYAGRPTHPIGVALADAVRRHPLERRHFDEIITGVETDLRQHRYETFDALETYCYRVASCVGLLCIEIFGHRHASARRYAVDLGIACQLTNILRDVREDARRGRIYLPLEDLRRFEVGEAELLAGRYSPSLAALLAFECGRARALYLRARGTLDDEDRVQLATAEAMRRIYERLLDRIEARHFDVFGGRVTLPGYQKVSLALATWGRSQWA